MIVVCAGMYRACSTWQYDVAAHLIERHRGGHRMGYLVPGAFAAWPPARRHPRDDWYVVKSHEGGPAFAAALTSGRATALYAHRDLRDVVVSMLRKRQQSFEAFVREGMVHQILTNDRFWNARPGVLTQRYEAVVADPVGAVVELARHLGIRLGPGESQRIADEYSFEATRRRLDGLAARLAAQGVDLVDPGNAQLYDATTLLHWNHLHEGKVGGWRDQAAPVERAVLRRLCARWLSTHGYPADAEAPAWSGLSRGDRRHWGKVIARGRIACASRGLSLRYPRLASAAKRALGVAEPMAARPVPAPHSALPAPHAGVRESRLA